MIENRFLDLEGVCKYIHFSRSTVYKLVNTNSIPYIKLGGKLLFDIPQIDRWVLNGGLMEKEIPQLPSLN
jgi:excisionase family DNA binding protein